jgi:hypothetical protein
MKAIIKRYDNRVEIWQEKELNKFEKTFMQFYPEIGWIVPREIYDRCEVIYEDHRLIKE